jgi:hypothetical protein
MGYEIKIEYPRVTYQVLENPKMSWPGLEIMTKKGFRESRMVSWFVGGEKIRER